MSLPATKPCTDPRHVGPIREQLGCVGPDPAAPIEVGQTYRPAPYNAARRPEDRATITTVYDAEPGDERTIAYDIATVDHRNRPTTYSSAMPESAFRKGYVLDTPEPAPETSADVVARAIALLDTLDGVTYAIVTPDTDDTIDVKGRTKGMDAAHGVEGLRSMADAMSIREAQRRMADATVPGLPDLFARAETVDALKRPPGCPSRPVSVEVTGTVDQAAVARAIRQALGPARATREQQRAKAKAQVLREIADGLEDRNGNCGISLNCERCSARAAEAARLRAERAELIQQRDRIADDTIKALAAESSLDGHARRLAEQITALGKARGWSTWAADFIHPDREFVDTGAPAVAEQPADPARVHCAHGYVLAQDSCPGCDSEQEQAHPADPTTVRPSWAKDDRRMCRRCGLSPSHKVHRAP